MIGGKPTAVPDAGVPGSREPIPRSTPALQPVSEFPLGTAVVLFWGSWPSPTAEFALGEPEPVLIGAVVWAIGLSLGGLTGYAINPARDFGPRWPSAPAGLGDFGVPLFTGATSGSPLVAPLVGVPAVRFPLRSRDPSLPPSPKSPIPPAPLALTRTLFPVILDGSRNLTMPSHSYPERLLVGAPLRAFYHYA